MYSKFRISSTRQESDSFNLTFSIARANPNSGYPGIEGFDQNRTWVPITQQEILPLLQDELIKITENIKFYANTPSLSSQITYEEKSKVIIDRLIEQLYQFQNQRDS